MELAKELHLQKITHEKKKIRFQNPPTKKQAGDSGEVG